MRKFFAMMPSPTFYRWLGTLGVLVGLALCGWGMQIFVEQPVPSRQWWLVGVGACSLLFGLLHPMRIVLIGAQVPPEIHRTLLVLALCFPLGGVGLVVGGSSLSPALQAAGLALGGLSACVAALAGLWRLSFSLPRTFYMGEMVPIFLSAGLFGRKEDSPADNAFRRWTQGRVFGVAVGEDAPDGEVVTLDGASRRLSAYFGDGQDDAVLVLNFGSYSCPHHRKRLCELQEIQARWQDKGVRFLTVYTAEAHPEDGWRLENQYAHDDEFTGNSDDFCFNYAKSISERQEMASWLRDKKSLQMDIVVDNMEDSLLRAYNSWPIRLYIIVQGKVAYSGKQGPFGYAPYELHDALNHLTQTSASSPSMASSPA